MKTDRLMVTVRAADTELGRLTALLSSFADMPPVIPYDLTVLGEPGSQKIQDYCSRCQGVGYQERQEDLGVVLDRIARESECNLQLVLHPDVIFANPAWCEAIFSKMIESGSTLFGAMPFRMLKVREQDVSVFASWFIAYDATQITKIGGFASDCGEASWVAAYLRAKKMSMHCVGAELSGVVVHTNRCWLDTGRNPAEQARDQSSIEIVAIKENLL